MRVSVASPPGAVSARDALPAASWGVAVVIRPKVIKLVINKMRTDSGFIESPPHRENSARGIASNELECRSVVAGAWAHVQSPTMDARGANKVTRLAFCGPSQFWLRTSQFCARRFETFLSIEHL